MTLHSDLRRRQVDRRNIRKPRRKKGKAVFVRCFSTAEDTKINETRLAYVDRLPVVLNIIIFHLQTRPIWVVGTQSNFLLLQHHHSTANRLALFDILLGGYTVLRKVCLHQARFRLDATSKLIYHLLIYTLSIEF
jgi:hypothetical protein